MIEVEDLVAVQDFLRNKPSKIKDQVKVRFECNVCKRQTVLSGRSFMNKNELICGRCSQKEKLKRHIANNKEEWVGRWKTAIKDKYGVDNAAHIDEVKEKKKATNLKKYGTEYHVASPEVRKKILKTFNEKYGGDSPWVDPAIQEKIDTTNMERYGARRFLATEEGKKKLIDSNMENYGVRSTAELPEVQAKRRATNLERYGVEEPAATEEWQKRRAKIMMEKYGCTVPIHNEEIKERILKNSTPGKHFKGYHYDERNFDSSYELAYYIWLKDTGKKFLYHPDVFFNYKGSDGKMHKYCPDFLVEGTFYEIKGGMFFNEKDEPYNPYTKKFWWEKYNALQKHNVVILREENVKVAFDHVEGNYGPKFLKECKNKKRR